MKRLRRSSALLLLPLACALAMAACQWLPWFGDADVPGVPGAADAPLGATAVPPTLPGLEYGGLSRLELVTPAAPATATPEPTVTPTPVPTPTRATGSRTVELPAEYSLVCEAHYRELLVEEAERLREQERPFRAEAVSAVGARFLELRDDCAYQGFAPEPALGMPCYNGWGVHEAEVSFDLLSEVGKKSRRRLGPTGSDAAGNILVQFERLPYESRPGCWYYEASNRLWSWRVAAEPGERVRSGRELPDLSGCDLQLRQRMSGGFERIVEVSRMVDRIRAADAHCRDRGWHPWPARERTAGCGLAQADVWVYWLAPANLPADGAACWAKPGVRVSGSDAGATPAVEPTVTLTATPEPTAVLAPAEAPEPGQ